MNCEFDFQLLKKLCLADGVTGFEDQVRDIIIEEIREYCDDLIVDALGNIIAKKCGKKTHQKRLMICAHMDEVGFCIKAINDDGTLLVDEVGMNVNIMPSKRVHVKNSEIFGVIGSKPVHLSKRSDGNATIDDIFIDIGASSKKDAEKMGVFGEYAAFAGDWCEFGQELVKVKALDDRMGCAVMCQLLKQQLEYDTYFAFTVGEEVGGVGASAATERIKPDICLVLEGTTASDIAGTDEKDVVCRVGNGPVCPFMDGGTMYDYKLYTGIRNLARKNNIKCQTKEKIAGGTDARNIQRTAGGVRVAALSLACRYIHSPTSVASKNDMVDLYTLATLAASQIFDM